MKKKIRFLLYPIILIGGFFILTNSCKKEYIKNEPVVIWENPADISVGVKLGLVQLNCTANVPGVFSYTPAIGTNLNEGANQILKVDFIPTDNEHYISVSKTVKINVLTLPLVVDADGNIYHSVIIGSQIWLVENLKTTKYNDGTAIPNETNSTAWAALTTPAYCWYNNDVVINKDTYGAIYNWYTVNTGKLCPAGYHVPTDVEWTSLENYLVANGYNFDDSSINSLFAKSIASETGWSLSTIEGAIGNIDYPNKKNATGFTALPGGFRNRSDGVFQGIMEACCWWSSSEYGLYNAFYRGLNIHYLMFAGNKADKIYGFYVRCIKD